MLECRSPPIGQGSPLQLNMDQIQNPIHHELALRKMKKRLQLKNLLINKFRNKHYAHDDTKDAVNIFIQQEMDQLFESGINFDERDLIAVDRSIRDYTR